jgi:iron(III) transport system permease protein
MKLLSRERFRYWTAIPLFAVLVGYILYPLIRVFIESLTDRSGNLSLANYIAFFDPQRPSNVEALLTSLGLAFASVLVAALVGVPLAFLLTKYRFPGSRIVSSLVIIPMVFPPLISVLAYVFLYGEAGFIPRGLQDLFGLSSPPFYIKGLGGILVIHAYTMFIYFYMLTSSALKKIDSSIDEAARNLGGKFWFRFRKITFPLITPGLVGASLLVFMIAMASFSAPFLLGGRNRFLSLQIYISKLNGNMQMAATQSTILALICFIFLLFIRYVSQKRDYKMVSKGVSNATSDIKSRLGKWGAMILSILILIVLSLPQVTLFIISLVPIGTWTHQTFPPKYSFVNYIEIFSNPRFFNSIKNSLIMSSIATLGAVIIGSLVAYFLSKKDFKSRWAMEILAMLPWALPGTIIAINLIITFNRPTFLTGGQILVGTYFILPIAYMIRNIPLLVRSTFAVFEQLDESLEEAGRNLGGNWFYVFRRVIFPNILPGIISGALLTLVANIGEFTSSVMLYTYHNKPMSMEILDQMQRFNFGAAAALGILQVVLMAAVMLITNRYLGNKRGAVVYF